MRDQLDSEAARLILEQFFLEQAAPQSHSLG
jgi:hypothetical protein